MILLAALAGATTINLSPGADVAALTAALSAGDEVIFSPGVYTIPSPITWTGQGTAEAPITLRGEGDVILELVSGWTVAYLGPASHVVVEGLTFRGAATNVEGHYGLYVEETSDVTIRDCEFGPTSRAAVVVTGNTTGMVFEGNHIHDVADGSGLYVGCSDASCWSTGGSFSGNWIHGLAGTDDYAIYFAPGNQGNAILDNVIYGTAYRGVLLDSAELGDPNVLEGNAVWGVPSTGIRVAGAAQVRNNLVFNAGEYGIHASNNSRDTLENLVISHNTVAATGGFAAYLEGWAGKPNMVFANNALSNPTGYGLAAAEGGIDDANYLSHNVVSGLVYRLDLYAGTAAPYLAGAGDTDFVDPEGWDFYPAAGSTLVGAADPSSSAWVPGTDFNGAPRDGGSPDVGAYEWDGAGNPGWVVQEGFKQLGVDDGGDDEVLGGCCKDKADAEADAALFLPVAGLGWLLRRRRPRMNRRPPRA